MLLLGASTVKWIALDPCIGLSESDTKFTSFEFCERKDLNLIIKHWSTKPSNVRWQKQSQKKCLQTVEDNASRSANGDIEQVIVKILFKIW